MSDKRTIGITLDRHQEKSIPVIILTEDQIEDVLVQVWLREYSPKGICTLCANSGLIDTRGLHSPAGDEVGDKNFCICPNGFSMRKLAAQ